MSSGRVVVPPSTGREATVQIDQMRAFLVAAEEPSLRRAARRLHLSQAALSERLTRLEHALKVPLLERGPGGSTLTSHGERLLPVVRAAVRAVDDVVDAAGERLRAGTETTVRVGVQLDGVEELTWPVLRAVRSWLPTPRLVVVPTGWESCTAAVADGRLDAVLARGPFGDPRLEVTTLAWASVGALVSSRHPLADADAIEPATLAEHAVLRPPPGTDAAFRRFWNQEDRGASASPSLEVGEATIEGLALTVANRRVAGLLPAALAPVAAAAGASYRPLTEDVRCPLQVLALPGSRVGAAVATTATHVASRMLPLLPHLRPPEPARQGA